MNRFGLTFHHLGIAVSKPETAIHFLENMGYKTDNHLYDPLQNVNLIMCNGNGMPDIELIFPSETKGPLDKMLSERREMIYHLCYQTSKINDTVQQMKNAAIRVVCISSPKPAILFDNHLVAFYQVAGFGLIELLEMES